MSAGLRRGLLYGALALCLMGFCYVQGRSDAIDQIALQHAETLVAGHTGYLRVIDSLKGAEARYVGLEGFWRAKADSIARTLTRTSLLPSHTDTSSGRNGIPQADSLRVIFLGRALDACDASREAADSALARCGRRADSLETSLREVLAVKSCRFLFFKCPSRSEFFILGAVGGALLESRISR